MMKNTKDKKIFFDLMLIEIINILDNKTNVRIADNSGKKVINNEVNKAKEINIETKKEDTINDENYEKSNDYKDYLDLMDVRLNNILAKADKDSLKEYLEFFTKLEENLDNLDERKIYNLLLDCTIKAGSKNGIIITASNDNILHELFENLEDIQSLYINKLQKQISICFYKEDLWNVKRQEYINKIKNKEKIELLDETLILNKINKKNESNKSEFDDLLEIGE